MKNKNPIEDTESLVKINESLRYCKHSKEELIREINIINRQLKSNLVTKEEYNIFFSQRLDGKTRLEWLDFCNQYIKEKEGPVSERRKAPKEFNKDIILCKKSKEAVIKELEELNKDYKQGLIGKKEYSLYLNRKINGKTKLEWLDFCNKYIEGKEKSVSKAKNPIEKENPKPPLQ